MNGGSHSRLQKIRYFVNLACLYLLTIIFGWYILQLPSSLSHGAKLTAAQQQPYSPVSLQTAAVTGLPTRIVIPSEAIDIPIEPGYYDSASGGWTLSGYDAQFAMISTVANNLSGDTFIYGHNNDFVFGALRHITPTQGASALIYTDNSHIFAYTFENAVSLAPDDTSVLAYNGPPMLTIQTCTGSLNEWRTMYRFAFDRVVE